MTGPLTSIFPDSRYRMVNDIWVEMRPFVRPLHRRVSRVFLLQDLAVLGFEVFHPIGRDLFL